MKDKDIVCTCFGITKKEIVDAIKKGAKTVDEVMEATSAGTACGMCIDQIEQIIKETLKK